MSRCACTYSGSSGIRFLPQYAAIVRKNTHHWEKYSKESHRTTRSNCTWVTGRPWLHGQTHTLISTEQKNLSFLIHLRIFSSWSTMSWRDVVTFVICLKKIKIKFRNELLIKYKTLTIKGRKACFSYTQQFHTVQVTVEAYLLCTIQRLQGPTSFPWGADSTMWLQGPSLVTPRRHSEITHAHFTHQLDQD